jgi:hypothetical protein
VPFVPFVPELMLTLRTVSEIGNVLLLLTTICAIGLSCVALLSQAVRTAPNRSWHRNYNALVIGASYVIVVRALLIRKMYQVIDGTLFVAARYFCLHVHGSKNESQT